MWSFLSFGSSDKQGVRRGKRAEERFPTNLLTTNLGDVVDISASGVRIRATSRPAGLAVGAVVPLTIRSPQCKVVVQSRVVRAGRTSVPGARGTDVCLSFLDAKPGLRAAIAHLGRFGFIPRLGFGSAGESSKPGGAKPAERKPRNIPDYYGLLGIPPTATAEQIRRAYHKLAKEHHPDTARSSESVGMFEAMAQAYQTLRDPQKRKTYDAARDEANLLAA